MLKGVNPTRSPTLTLPSEYKTTPVQGFSFSILKLFRSTGAEFSEQTMQEFANRPLSQAITGLKEAIETQKKVSDNESNKNKTYVVQSSSYSVK